MAGKFFIGSDAFLQVEDINKDTMLCSFHSLLNYRIIGDANEPEALDPSGGPFIVLGYEINNKSLTRIWWNAEQKQYLMFFEKK